MCSTAFSADAVRVKRTHARPRGSPEPLNVGRCTSSTDPYAEKISCRCHEATSFVRPVTLMLGIGVGVRERRRWCCGERECVCDRERKGERPRGEYSPQLGYSSRPSIVLLCELPPGTGASTGAGDLDLDGDPDRDRDLGLDIDLDLDLDVDRDLDFDLDLDPDLAVALLLESVICNCFASIRGAALLRVVLSRIFSFRRCSRRSLGPGELQYDARGERCELRFAPGASPAPSVPTKRLVGSRAPRACACARPPSRARKNNTCLLLRSTSFPYPHAESAIMSDHEEQGASPGGCRADPR